MGWSSGGMIFDTVVGSLRDVKVTNVQFEAIINDLVDVLDDLDWNRLSETSYYDDPVIREIFELDQE